MTIFFSSDFANRAEISRKIASGQLLTLTRGVYSDEVRTKPEEIVRRNWQTIVANALPGAVVTYRSGFQWLPQAGYLFVSHERTRDYELPGLTVVSDGLRIGALPDDVQITSGLYGASQQRALIDNLAASRARGGRPTRTLSRAELHDRIVGISQSRTDRQVARLLDAVRSQAVARGLVDRAETIGVFFESAAGDRPTVDTDSPAMRAAQRGKGYDRGRVKQFQLLANELRLLAPRIRPEAAAYRQSALPFFEAYFSNYIEGTEFTLDEAIDIAINGNIPAERPQDAHDIAGTYRIVSDRDEMSLRLTDVESWIDALKRRHAAVMEGRPESLPGAYKIRPNRAGGTVFVLPELVDGTLRVGYEILQGIDDPFARAAFTMYFASEVHPFSDGNGRTVRMMMNGELVSAGQARIIVPTIMRRDYTSGLTGVSANSHIAGLVSVLDFAQQYTGQVDFSSLESANAVLSETNAYLEPSDADNAGLRLRLPADLAPYRQSRAATPNAASGNDELVAHERSEEEIALGRFSQGL